MVGNVVPHLQNIMAASFFPDEIETGVRSILCRYSNVSPRERLCVVRNLPVAIVCHTTPHHLGPNKTLNKCSQPQFAYVTTFPFFPSNRS